METKLITTDFVLFSVWFLCAIVSWLILLVIDSALREEVRSKEQVVMSSGTECFIPAVDQITQ